MAGAFPQCASLLPEIEELIEIIDSMKMTHQQQTTLRPHLETGQKGRPRYSIPREQLELLIGLHFTNKDIANMIGVSESVIKRRLRHYGLNRQQKFSAMTDEELDSHVRRLTDGNPLLGQRNVVGMLAAEGSIVQRDRVAASLARVDAAAVAMRWSRTIHRRSYKVAGPNALWHIDGNHKLIRWGFVIHGGIDGFSRLIVFLHLSTNNRADTVFSSFVAATANYGIPSRVRCDHGGENVDVATFMNVHRGQNRGSCITGRSVHNQRIERFWRDMYTGCTFVYKELFMWMEGEGILNPDSSVQVWCLHYVFVPRINKALQKFVDGWNHHRLSSEGGKTPLQLYVQGLIQHRGVGQTGVDSLYFDPPSTDEAVDEDYGIDWDGPVPPEQPNTGLSDINCPLSAEQLSTLKEMVDPLSQSADFGVDLYRRTLEFCTP